MLVKGSAMTRLAVENQSTLDIQDDVVISPLKPISNALDRVFTSQAEETKIQKTRRIMGTTADQLSDEELEVYITEFQYLIDEWLDEFERQAFYGQTLKQVLCQE